MLPCLRFVRHLIYFKNNIPLALKWMCNCILQKWINDLTPLHSMCTTMHEAIATCRRIDRQLGFQFTLTINTVRKSLQNPLSISEILKMFWKSEQTSPRWLSKKKKQTTPYCTDRYSCHQTSNVIFEVYIQPHLNLGDGRGCIQGSCLVVWLINKRTELYASLSEVPPEPSPSPGFPGKLNNTLCSKKHLPLCR